MGVDAQQRELGAFYTQGNPFFYRGFQEWASTLPPHAALVEPFAGSGQIPRLVAEAGHLYQWTSYDVDQRVESVIHQDTLSTFPEGFTVVITNPPYLSYHFAVRKGLTVDKAYFRGYPSLYLTAIDLALAASPFVGMIVPESFITTGHFRARLNHVVSLPERMFDDTEMPTALALWGPTVSDSFTVWRQDDRIGTYDQLAAALVPTPCAQHIRFNVREGSIGLKAVDDTRTPSICFCAPEEIPAEKIKRSARLVSRIEIGCPHNPKSVIPRANELLDEWRVQTEDVLLTAFKGIRADGRFRRRLDFKNARAILSRALCGADGCEHGVDTVS